jgi:hypothetical protein
VPSRNLGSRRAKGGLQVKLRSIRIAASTSLVTLVWMALTAVAALAGSETPPLPR